MTIDDYVRPFESLRALLPELPPGPPEFVRPLAAVTLRARLQRRDLRDETIELTQAIADTLPRTPPPPPSEWGDVSRTILAEIVRRQPCTLCGVRPGFGPCPACVGSGCDECAEGWVKCTTCDGACEILIATLRHVEDREVTIRHTFMPQTTRALDEALLSRFLEDEPDECLRIDVDLRTSGSPYREVEAGVRIGGTFHGHAFVQAIERARVAVASIAGTDWVREEVQAYARPFLWVAWDVEPTATREHYAIVSSPVTAHLLRT